MKVKRKVLFDLAEAFYNVRSLGGGGKLGYLIAKNKRAITREFDDSQKILEFSKEFEEYNNKRIELCKEFADKDESGKPKTIKVPAGIRYVGVDTNKEFIEKTTKLKEEYQEEVDKQNEKGEAYNKAVEEEIEFDLHKIQFNELPKDISVGQTEDLYLIIEEEVATKLKLQK